MNFKLLPLVAALSFSLIGCGGGGGSSDTVAPPVTPEVTPPVEPEVTPPVEPEVTPPVEPEVTPPVEPEVTPPVEPETPVYEKIAELLNEDSNLVRNVCEQHKCSLDNETPFFSMGANTFYLPLTNQVYVTNHSEYESNGTVTLTGLQLSSQYGSRVSSANYDHLPLSLTQVNNKLSYSGLFTLHANQVDSAYHQSGSFCNSISPRPTPINLYMKTYYNPTPENTVYFSSLRTQVFIADCKDEKKEITNLGQLIYNRSLVL
ncbi:hypothetical protein [Photobacterium leiognathi]|uniref:hypothetical protein n=1 Tax=Photobacterium leiognathi TaxID=553611 RepID=UPI0029822A9F|nr:hypothetical protein [Photobacterium leiognathi]